MLAGAFGLISNVASNFRFAAGIGSALSCLNEGVIGTHTQAAAVEPLNFLFVSEPNYN